MAQSSFPFENIDTTETQYSQLFRTLNNGVNGTPDGGELEVGPASAGLAVDIAAGQAMVRGHFYISTAVETRSLAVADSSNDRIDLVVLRLDPIANTIILAVKTGTPDAAPVAPALVQTDGGIFEQPLANVLVPAEAGVPSTITDRREFMGTKLGTWTTDGRPVPAGRVLFGFNTTLEAVEFYDPINEVWGPVAPEINSLDDIGDVTITTPGDGELLAYDDGTSEWVNQALTAAQLPTGSIIAYKFVQKTDVQNTSLASNATADVTNLSITHTASNGSNKIIVRAFLNVGTVSSRPRTALIAYDGTVVADSIGDADGVRARVSLTGGPGTGNPERVMTTGHGFAVITPGDTSSHTYNVKILNANDTTSTVHVNRSSDDTNSLSGGGRGMSYIELMEVVA